MNLPKVILELVKAQDNFDSTAYANCFTDTAVVFDEGKNYQGGGGKRKSKIGLIKPTRRTR